jgi:hypothetical protein
LGSLRVDALPSGAMIAVGGPIGRSVSGIGGTIDTCVVGGAGTAIIGGPIGSKPCDCDATLASGGAPDGSMGAAMTVGAFAGRTMSGAVVTSPGANGGGPPDTLPGGANGTPPNNGGPLGAAERAPGESGPPPNSGGPCDGPPGGGNGGPPPCGGNCVEPNGGAPPCGPNGGFVGDAPWDGGYGGAPPGGPNGGLVGDAAPG